MAPTDNPPPRATLLGARIGACRREARKTVDELAAAVGVARITVRRWESGATEPVAEKRPRLAAALEVPYHRLFVPEETAHRLWDNHRALMLSAKRIVRGGNGYYARVNGETPWTTHDASVLYALWLVERFTRERDTWKLTGPGEDVATVLRGWERR